MMDRARLENIVFSVNTVQQMTSTWSDIEMYAGMMGSRDDESLDGLKAKLSDLIASMEGRGFGKAYTLELCSRLRHVPDGFTDFVSTEFKI